jgi:hypothetical protein
MKQSKRDNPGHRYNPGFISLATEVLRQAHMEGVSNENLSHSIWAEFLMWYERNSRTTGVRHGHMHKLEPVKREGEYD